MDLLDTALNVSTFVVIGVLVWLYLKPEPPGDGAAGKPPGAPVEREP